MKQLKLLWTAVLAPIAAFPPQCFAESFEHPWLHKPSVNSLHRAPEISMRRDHRVGDLGFLSEDEIGSVVAPGRRDGVVNLLELRGQGLDLFFEQQGPPILRRREADEHPVH